MKKYIFSGIVTLLLVGTVTVPHITQAETSTNTQMLEQIKALMAKVEELQKQLAVLRGEVKSVLKDGLSEGMTDADIAKLQELLATDPTIYPEGKKTGYFGPLTKEAIKRFQARHGLEITGKVDEETKDMLEEYLHEGFGGTIPVGLLKAPGIAKKVEDRFLLGCDKRHGGGKGMGPLCKKWKEEHGKNTDDDSDDENDDDSDEQEDAFHVEVEVEDGDAVVSFKFEGKRYEVDVDGTNIDDVLEEVADELDVDVADVDEDLADAIESELEDAIDENDEEDFDVEIEIEDDETTVSFEFDDDDYEFTIDSTDEDTILEKVANELDIDVEDIDEDLEDAIKDALADAKDAE